MWNVGNLYTNFSCTSSHVPMSAYVGPFPLSPNWMKACFGKPLVVVVHEVAQQIQVWIQPWMWVVGSIFSSEILKDEKSVADLLSPRPATLNFPDSWSLPTSCANLAIEVWRLLSNMQHRVHIYDSHVIHTMAVLANGNCPGHLQVQMSDLLCPCWIWYRASQMILTKTSVNPQWELFQLSFGNNVMFNQNERDHHLWALRDVLRRNEHVTQKHGFPFKGVVYIL